MAFFENIFLFLLKHKLKCLGYVFGHVLGITITLYLTRNMTNSERRRHVFKNTLILFAAQMARLGGTTL